MAHKRRALPPAAQLLLILGGATLLVVLVALALGSGASPGPGEPTVTTPVVTLPPPPVASPTPLPATIDRSAPLVVQNRVAEALQNNQPDAIFNELSDADRAGANYAAFVQNFQSTLAANGPIQRVTVVADPVVLTESPWNGEWAEGITEIAWANRVEQYRVIYHREGDRWWLFATEPVTPSVSP